MGILTPELLERQYNSNRVTISSSVSGDAGSLSACCSLDIYKEFQNANKVLYQVSCGVSANRAGIEATIDGANWYRLVSVSGVQTISGVASSNPYINYRGFTDTYSSGTIQYDFIEKF